MTTRIADDFGAIKHRMAEIAGEIGAGQPGPHINDAANAAYVEMVQKAVKSPVWHPLYGYGAAPDQGDSGDETGG